MFLIKKKKKFYRIRNRYLLVPTYLLTYIIIFMCMYLIRLLPKLFSIVGTLQIKFKIMPFHSTKMKKKWIPQDQNQCHIYHYYQVDCVYIKNNYLFTIKRRDFQRTWKKCHFTSQVTVVLAKHKTNNIIILTLIFVQTYRPFYMVMYVLHYYK